MKLYAFRFVIVTSILISLISTGSVAAAIQDKQFETGIKYFQDKDYKKALTAFKKAYKSGKHTPALEYNIGVCHYKLGQYKQARKVFKNLRINKKYRQIADYNLGLIAAKQNKKKTATYWFKKSIQKKGNKKINRLAQYSLKSLSSKKTTVSRPWSANVFMALGSDNNVTLSTDQSPSQKSDQYMEMFAYGERKVAKKYTLDGSYHWLNYFDINAGDFQQARLGIRTNYKYTRWLLTPHLHIAQSRLTTGSFQRQLDLKFSAKKNLDKNSFIKLRLRHTDIDSLNPLYDYLQGNRQQLRGDYNTRTTAGDLRLRYELELNNRQNSATSNYSPTRHSLRARLKHHFIHAWTVTEELQYRLSDYDAAAVSSREDDRLRLIVSAAKKLGGNLKAGGKYTYTDNNSNLVAEKYTRSDIQLYLDYRF